MATALRSFGSGATMKLLVAGVAYWQQPIRGNPDPRGRILAQLAAVASSLPNDAVIAYRTDQEPKSDSCDGRRGTEGWDNASVSIGFTSGQAADDVLAHVEDAVGHLWVCHLGWESFSQAVVPQGVTASWSKAIQGAPGPGMLQLSAGNGDGVWLLLAQAPPVGRRASGC
jgi:hypothetical protein